MHVSVEPGDFWSRCVVHQEDIIVNDYSAVKPLKHGLPREHPRLDRFLVIPVVIEGRTVALLAVANKKTDYDASDVRQLRLL
jgi:GAF domain-containing protein